MTRSASAAVAVSAILLAVLPSTGCRNERYFGPFQITLPTTINERSAGRTFRLPLDELDQRESESLADCERAEPEREVPCICDFPVLRIRERLLRVDYRLEQKHGEPGNVIVWIGLPADPDQPPLQELLDLPEVEVFAEHLHRMETGKTVMDGFLEAEVDEVSRVWSTSRFPTCQQENNQPPAPTELLVGASISSDRTAQVVLEYTFRVREND